MPTYNPEDKIKTLIWGVMISLIFCIVGGSYNCWPALIFGVVGLAIAVGYMIFHSAQDAKAEQEEEELFARLMADISPPGRRRPNSEK